MTATADPTSVPREVPLDLVTRALRDVLRAIKPAAIGSIDVTSPTGETATVEVAA